MKAIAAWILVLTAPTGVGNGRAAEISEDDLGAFTRPPAGKVGSYATQDAKGEVARVAATASFKEWKTFEDDRVKFSYPVDEAISVVVKTNKPHDNPSISWRYRLMVVDDAICNIGLGDADWFSDGTCFCGEIEYERYLVRNGHLYRFGFLENGVLKTMQVLGDGERLSIPEWTHLPIHPEVYRKIARSVELKRKGSRTTEDSRNSVKERYGAEGLMGWFDLGTTVESVEQQIGPPIRTEKSGHRIWEYPKQENDYRWTETLTLPFKNGRMTRLQVGFHDHGWYRREAIEDSVAWMREQGQTYRPEERELGQDPGPMPDPLKARLLKLFLEKANDPKEDFESLCGVLEDLIEQDVRDAQALNIVRRRFKTEGGFRAAWVLHEAGHDEDHALFVEKIQALYTRALEDPGEDSESLPLEELKNWLFFLPKEADAFPELLWSGLMSPNQGVRAIAYHYVGSSALTPKERAAFVRVGLRDSSPDVRRDAAANFNRQPMTEEDWALLAQVAEQETDEYTSKELQKALEHKGR